VRLRKQCSGFKKKLRVGHIVAGDVNSELAWGVHLVPIILQLEDHFSLGWNCTFHREPWDLQSPECRVSPENWS
jgi:hypothetical protein